MFFSLTYYRFSVPVNISNCTAKYNVVHVFDWFLKLWPVSSNIDFQLPLQGGSKGTSFSISNPSYENVILRKPKSKSDNKENRIVHNSQRQYHASDEQGSLDSSETKPKQPKLLNETNNKLNSTMPDLRDNSKDLTPPNSHSRSKSQDPIADCPLPVKKNESLKINESEKGSGYIIKSQSFPQHSAPVKKGQWPEVTSVFLKVENCLKYFNWIT